MPGASPSLIKTRYQDRADNRPRNNYLPLRALRFGPNASTVTLPTVPFENAARAVRAVRGQVPTPGSLPPEVPTSLGTHYPEYLPP